MARHWDTIREDLRRAIEARVGSFGTRAVSEVASQAGVSYTTLARFLHLYSDKRQQTHRLHQGTLIRVAKALDVDPESLGTKQVAEQLGFWPQLFRPDEIAMVDPYQEARRALAVVQRYSRHVQMQICRAVVAGLLDSGVSAGVILPADVYEALVKLDLGRGMSAMTERAEVA